MDGIAALPAGFRRRREKVFGQDGGNLSTGTPSVINTSPSRLDVFRLLVRNVPSGGGGETARTLEIPHNTLSTHLGILTCSGLVQSKRQSRSIIYRTNLESFRAMMMFLVSEGRQSKIIGRHMTV
jgi:DNA-binding transcriptional ArsR family regulator